MAGCQRDAQAQTGTVERFERDFKLRLPFRFGVITVTEGTQAVIRATVALEDGRTGVGRGRREPRRQVVRQEPGLQRRPEPRSAAPGPGACHRALSRSSGWSTPFGLYAGTYRDQLARGAELGLVPLVASYGPALLDRAILDALGRATGAVLRRDDPPQRRRASRRSRADARSRRLRPAALPGAACARAATSPCATRSASSIRSSRPTRRRRARQRRPAGDARGGRARTTAAATTS